jgi:hypothetical protein
VATPKGEGTRVRIDRGMPFKNILWIVFGEKTNCQFKKA